MPSQVFAQGLLDGQVVVVTGGGSGLGRATAVELAACGAQVVIAGRRQEPLDETASMCEGGRCEGFVCDIREEDQVEAFVDRVLSSHGRIDTLVNNAGGQYMTPAEDISPKGFDTVQRLNVRGTWLMTHAVATKSMIPGERSRPSNTSRPRDVLASQISVACANDGAAARTARAMRLDRVMSGSF